MTEDEIARLEGLIRSIGTMVESGGNADILRTELAFAVPDLVSEVHKLRRALRQVATHVSWNCDCSSRVPVPPGSEDALAHYCADQAEHLISEAIGPIKRSGTPEERLLDAVSPRRRGRKH